MVLVCSKIDVQHRNDSVKTMTYFVVLGYKQRFIPGKWNPLKTTIQGEQYI